MPSKITFTEKNAYIRNMYDANGHKFKMILVIGRAAPAKASAKAILPGQVADSLLRNNSLGDRLIPSNELPCVAGQTTYDYCGNIVYKNGIPTIYREDGFSTLARMRFPEFHYYIRDHERLLSLRGHDGEQHRRSRAALPLHWQGAGPLPGP